MDEIVEVFITLCYNKLMPHFHYVMVRKQDLIKVKGIFFFSHITLNYFSLPTFLLKITRTEIVFCAPKMFLSKEEFKLKENLESQPSSECTKRNVIKHKNDRKMLVTTQSLWSTKEFFETKFRGKQIRRSFSILIDDVRILWWDEWLTVKCKTE